MNDPLKEERENESGEDVAADTTGKATDEVVDEPAADEAADPASPEGGDEEPAAEELTVEDRLRNERDAFEAKWLRVVAEMDNVRKRNRRELGETRRFAQADVLRSFLEVMDNFDRAMLSKGDAEDSDVGDAFREGVDLIHQNFRRIFRDKGVEQIEAFEAEFDPNVHEAVSQMPREGVEAGHVIEVVREGYTFGDMVLRPARVIISS